jgi:hypothetical protein
MEHMGELELSKLKSYIDETIEDELDLDPHHNKINIYESKPTNALLTR